MMEHIFRVEEVKEPLKKGANYLVPCIVKEEYGQTYITPVINHPHSDKENGQKEVHYHVDYRFVKHKNDGNFPTTINKHSTHRYVHNKRPVKGRDGKLEYIVLPMVNEDFTGITPKEFIQKTKLKHKCIHKGKCPHRGYNLSQVKANDGKITCPLHGLQFDSESVKLIN
jgi:hypothetical protein